MPSMYGRMTTLPARRLFNIIRELPSSEIRIEVDGKNAASIRSGQSFFKILGLPEEEFPPLPKFEDAKVVTIRQKDLRDGLRKTSYAISTDETRYVLNGVLFSFKDNKLTLVATDGRRLAMLSPPQGAIAHENAPPRTVRRRRRLAGRRLQPNTSGSGASTASTRADHVVHGVLRLGPV